MTGIQCYEGHIFAMCQDSYIDAEWKLQECYYMSQGCEVTKGEDLRFSKPDNNCPHCSVLEHKFEDLIEEIKNQ